MKYLVTGGAGFIGSHLVDYLLRAGHQVVVLDDFSTGRRENLPAWKEGTFTLVEGSITDLEPCHRSMEGVDYVLHQAALGSVPRSVENPHRTHEVNATGTLNVLTAARDAGIRRVVYAGSSSAYGDTEELPKHELMIPRPRSPYAVSKLTGEEYCRAFYRTYGLQTVALRYFNVFGPRQDPESEYAAVVPRFVTAALAGRPARIFGDGNHSRDFTFVSNVVRANLLACEASEEALGEVFNIGAGARTSINQLWSWITELTASESVAECRPPRVGDVRHSLAALDRARAVLNYEPLVDVKEGLRLTAKWYRSNTQVFV